MYGNRNRFSDDRIFGNELPAMAAQGEGPNAEMARKYNGTIISALREGKRIYITEGQFKKIVGHMLSECLPKANRFDN